MKAEQAFDDQIDRDDVIEDARHQQDEDAGEQRDDRLQIRERDIHEQISRRSMARAELPLAVIDERLGFAAVP
jgi:hypothetical protein